MGLGTHRLYLRLRETHHVVLINFHLAFTPMALLRWFRDAFENSFALAEFEIIAKMQVELLESNPFNFVLEAYAVNFPFSDSAAEVQALQPYLNSFLSATAVRIRSWLRTVLHNPRPIPSRIFHF